MVIETIPFEAILLLPLFGFYFGRNISRPIAIAAGQVASASSQVSSASQQLAEGASEQAAAMEETSSSLEEMASMTRQMRITPLRPTRSCRKPE
jgi:methyl-accepting chemotaxis protein